jgi:hypothetical protein
MKLFRVIIVLDVSGIDEDTVEATRLWARNMIDENVDFANDGTESLYEGVDIAVIEKAIDKTWVDEVIEKVVDNGAN